MCIRDRLLAGSAAVRPAAFKVIIFYSTSCTTRSFPLTILCQALSGNISTARTLLRFFDTLPMISYALDVGMARDVRRRRWCLTLIGAHDDYLQEKDSIKRCIIVAKNVVDTVFYPLEHLAFMVDIKLLDASIANRVLFWTKPAPTSDMLWYYSDLCWVVSLTGDIFLNIRELAGLVSVEDFVCCAIFTIFAYLLEHTR